MRHQTLDFGQRLVPAHVPARSHALHKIEPEFRVGRGILSRSACSTLLVTHVGQYCAPQLAFVEAKGQFSQITGKRVNVMVVLAGVLAKVIARQLARRPCPVEWMAEQVVSRDGCLKLLEEKSGIHDCLLVGYDSTLYGRAYRWASDGITAVVS